MSLLDLSRWQFAITVLFHMTFPAITVGLSILLCVTYGLHWRTGDPVYLQMFRFWRRIFAVGFAIGVVAGAVLTFDMGLNWGPYAAKTGPVIGPIIGMEVVTAFFVEAGFIGVLLYGDGRVRRGTMFAATVMVSIGTILSSTWIIAANSWMQTPAGFVIRDGRFEPTDWAKAIFNPSFLWRWPHMLAAVLISASFFVAGIGAYYLVKRRALPLRAPLGVDRARHRGDRDAGPAVPRRPCRGQPRAAGDPCPPPACRPGPGRARARGHERVFGRWSFDREARLRPLPGRSERWTRTSAPGTPAVNPDLSGRQRFRSVPVRSRADGPRWCLHRRGPTRDCWRGGARGTPG
jgi:hypothetical protein